MEKSTNGRIGVRMARCFTALVVAALAPVVLHAQPVVTVCENGRVIVGDGKLIENATFLVQDARITQVGPAATIKAPAGATRVSLAGKTGMPAIVGTACPTTHSRR